MARTAFDTIKVLDKLPARIESIECFGNRLLVGTNEGGLVVISVDLHDVDSEAARDLQTFKGFGKKAVTQLCAVEQFNVLLSLSGEQINIHDLTTFDFRATLGGKRAGANIFAVDDSGTRLAIAVKKKVYIMHWNGRQYIDYPREKEFTVPDPVRAMVWCGLSLCLGLKKDYVLLDTENGSCVEMMQAGRTGAPLLTVLPQKEMVVSKDQIGMVVGFDGKPTRKFGLSWTDIPIAQACSPPYMLALLPRGIEVRTIHSGQAPAQTIPMKGMKLLCANGDLVYVAGQTSLVRLGPVALRNQIDELQALQEYEEALALVNLLPESQRGIREAAANEINTKFGFELFRQGRYEDAMKHFIKAEFDVNQLLALYPALLPDGAQVSTLTPFEANLKGEELKRALDALVNFLWDKRKSVVSPLLAKVIDTALLKASLIVRPQSVQALLRAPNECDVKECESLLVKHRRDADLVELYRSKGMHEEALTLLAKCATQSDGELRGARPTIEYLSQLDRENMKLILRFSTWVLKQSPSEALTIFTTRRPDGMELPSKEVLAHLNIEAEQLSIPYLEFLIEKCNDKSAATHNDLALKYLRTVCVLRGKEPGGTELAPAGAEAGRLGKIRKKLLNFLETSTSYTPETMLSDFPQHDLFEERAILLSRINQHEGALAIYAHDLRDFRMAEEYCEKHYNDSTEENSHIYLSLLRTYLQPPDGTQPLLGPALALLNKHFARIDTAKALELLPLDTSLRKLLPYFENVLRTTSRARRHNQVLKHLLRSEALQVEEQQIHARSRFIRITDDSMCPICSKRMSTSAFVRAVDGSVMHLNCKPAYDRLMAEQQR